MIHIRLSVVAVNVNCDHRDLDGGFQYTSVSLPFLPGLREIDVMTNASVKFGIRVIGERRGKEKKNIGENDDGEESI